MDSESMRRQMDEVRAALTRNEAEHEILSDMLRVHQRWLDLSPRKAATETATQAPLLPAQNGRGKGGKPLGTLGFDAGVVEVLRQARGESLTQPEAWERMKLLGVRSNARNPVGWVGRSAKKLTEAGRAEKTGPKTWRWISYQNGAES